MSWVCVCVVGEWAIEAQELRLLMDLGMQSWQK